HRASRLRKQPSAEFAPAGANKSGLFSVGIHFRPKILLSPQVSKCAPEARSGDVSLLNAKPSEAGSR
ncbi:MAG: hypothetical protein J5633_10775, partial [Oscillospiraceae bacterium]|nr:hypothetical protein [Oscillospiraceae bacterium]